MTTGIASGTANGWVDGVTGTLYAKLHTGDPGVAGAANTSAETTRKLIAFAGASGGSATQSGSITWASWAAGSETISHISYWTAETAGTFEGSFQLTASKSMTNGDTLSVSGCTIAVTPVAA